MSNDTTTKLDTFTQAYIECALWSSTDNANEQGGEPLDANYGVEDIVSETLEKMREDCEAFQRDNADDLAACDLQSDRAGHDFWLNRNGHGSGFWDEGYRKDETINKALRRLSEASHTYGSVDLYVGDDGRIYGQ